jgi:CarboxypepD_reg-like domain
MKKFQLLIFTCFLSINLFSQNTKDLKGKIIDNKTKEVIAYAAIGLIKANQGISSNEKGDFIFKTVSIDDTLIASCVGYSTVKVAVMDFKSEIELTPSLIELNTVVIKPRKSKEVILNKFKIRDIEFNRVTSLREMSQIAQFFPNEDKKISYIKEITIGRNFINILLKARPSIYRLRFYGADQNNKPTNKDIFESILVKSDGKKYDVVDLSNKPLLIPENGIFVAIEWIRIEENSYIEEYEIKDKNGKKEKKTSIHYAPTIAYLENSPSEFEIYEMNNKNEWLQDTYFNFSHKKHRIAISLKLTD